MHLFITVHFHVNLSFTFSGSYTMKERHTHIILDENPITKWNTFLYSICLNENLEGGKSRVANQCEEQEITLWNKR